jgi:hypothetical protein
MLSRSTFRNSCVAIGLGAAWPPLFNAILVACGLCTYRPQLHLLKSLGVFSLEQLKVVLRISELVIWAALNALLFGVPLAVFVRRAVSGYWLLFLATVIITYGIWIVAFPPDPSIDMTSWEFLSAVTLTLPEFWGNVIGILIGWELAARMFSKTSTDSLAAP